MGKRKPESMRIRIDHKFTTLNEYIDAERSHRIIAAKIKKEETQIAWAAFYNCPPVTKYPIRIICHWYYADMRTDPDNISAGIKFILDGMVKAGVINGDGWKQIGGGIGHEFYLADSVYVEVEIIQ